MGPQTHLSDLWLIVSWFIPFLSSLIMIHKSVSMDLDLEGLSLWGPVDFYKFCRVTGGFKLSRLAHFTLFFDPYPTGNRFPEWSPHVFCDWPLHPWTGWAWDRDGGWVVFSFAPTAGLWLVPWALLTLVRSSWFWRLCRLSLESLSWVFQVHACGTDVLLPCRVCRWFWFIALFSLTPWLNHRGQSWSHHQAWSLG